MYQGLAPACGVAVFTVAGVVPSCGLPYEGSSAGGSKEGRRTMLANRDPRRPGRES